MPLGWIDFSKTDRNKVLTVLDTLSDQGTLDELGISSVRDGFANLFFPGTSTIQTRAKYFFIVPYIFKDLEKYPETNPYELEKKLSKLEEECGKHFLDINPDESGVIGKRSIRQNMWVKRPPSEIYWAGLRQYGIFLRGNSSIFECLQGICENNTIKKLQKTGNRKDNDPENDHDDVNAGDIRKRPYFRIPTYKPDWKDDYNMDLTNKEGAFLKERICESFPDSMMAYILKNNLDSCVKIESFHDLKSVIKVFPEEIRNDYRMAVDFSNFSYALRVVYNLIVSDGKNKRANKEIDSIRRDFKTLSKMDLKSILIRVSVSISSDLAMFLFDTQKYMRENDLEGLKECIIRREKNLKGTNRAKTCHPGEFNKDDWFCGNYLDYRFSDAKTIIKDIFESGGKKNA